MKWRRLEAATQWQSSQLVALFLLLRLLES